MREQPCPVNWSAVLTLLTFYLSRHFEADVGQRDEIKLIQRSLTVPICRYSRILGYYKWLSSLDES